jgi:hypothetical protein
MPQVFVATPRGFNAELLISSIDDANWKAINYADEQRTRRDEGPLSDSQLARADAVIAISSLADHTRDESVLLEAGLALGRGKPLLMIFDEGSPAMPDLPVSVSVARFALRNREAMQFHVRAFLAGLDGKTRQTNSRPRKELAPHDLARLRRSLTDLMANDSPSPQSFELWIVSLFRAGGVRTIQSLVIDRGFDVVANFPTDAWPFGPVLVEAKTIGRLAALERTVIRLGSTVSAERAGLGLIVYLRESVRMEEFGPRLASHDEAQNVVVATAESLMTRVELFGSIDRAILSIREDQIAE